MIFLKHNGCGSGHPALPEVQTGLKEEGGEILRKEVDAEYEPPRPEKVFVIHQN